MKNNKIIEGPIWKNMLSYFAALLLGAFFQQFYNTIDAVIVSRAVSSDALGAVGGSAAMIVSLFLGFFMGLSSGAAVIISQFYGAARKEEVHKAVHTAMALAFVGGIIITLVGYMITPWIIRAMNTPLELEEASIVYLRIYFLGMIPNLVYNMGAGILRAIGDSRRPLIVLIISSFVNIILDLLFVVGFGMGKKGDVSGVTGVAVATIISQLVSAALVVMILSRTDDSYRLDIRKIRFDPLMLGKIIRIGVPAGLQTTMYTLSNILIQSAINSFGKDATAAWAAYGKIDVLFWMTMNSLGSAVTTFAGQNYGVGRYDRVRKCARQGAVIAFVISVPLSTLLYIYGEFILRLFVKNSEVVRLGLAMIRFLAPFYVVYIGIEIFSGVLRGMGDAIVPMVITMSGVCVLRVIWILTVFPLNRTLEMVEASYPITWGTTTILYLIYYNYYIRKNKIK